MDEPNEAPEVELLEPETETVEVPDGEGETPAAAEEADGDVIVSIGDEPVSEPEPAQQGAPEWVKELRRANREKERRIRELERRLQEQAAPAETKPALGPKPTLEAADYDTERFERELAVWYDQKRKAEQQEAAARKAQEDQAQQWQGKLQSYTKAREALKVRDFEDAESAVVDTLSVTQQGMIIAGAENPALVVYALGKNPKRAAELAAIQDPVQFAFAVARLETQLKVQTRKPSTQPERVVTGSAPKGGADSTLERLRAEAERTGDFSKVVAYRRQLKQKRA